MTRTSGNVYPCLAGLTVCAASVGCGLAESSPGAPPQQQTTSGSPGEATQPDTLESSIDPVADVDDVDGTCATAGFRVLDAFTLPASSVRQGDLVASAGSGPRFQLPGEWFDWYDSFGNNLHLARSELDTVEHGSGDWDTEYSYVLESLLPFDRCAMHVGGEGWAGEGVSYADLQVRAYVVDETPAELMERAQATAWEDIAPEISTDQLGGWTQLLLSYDRWYGDYGGRANVDLRLQRLEDSTVILAGMYTDGWSSLDEFDSILGTVCVRSGDGAECCPL